MPGTSHASVARVVTRALPETALRDPALADLDIDRDALAGAPTRHSPCTGRWATAPHATGFDGALWHSRQADLHRAAQRDRGLAAALLTHVPVEFAVLWRPPAPDDVRETPSDPQPLWDGAGPSRLVVEFAALLGLILET